MQGTFERFRGHIRVNAAEEERNQKVECETGKYVKGREWGIPSCSTDEGDGGEAVFWLHSVTTATL